MLEACFLTEWAAWAVALGVLLCECLLCIWLAGRVADSWKDVFRD